MLLEGNTILGNLMIPVLGGIILIIAGIIIARLLIKRRIRFRIDYGKSFRTQFEGDHFIIIYLTIINDNEFSLNSVSFVSEPFYQLQDNIFSTPHIERDSSTTIVWPAFDMVEEAFGTESVVVPARDRKSGCLVFQVNSTTHTISRLLAQYQDRHFRINIRPYQIVYRNLS